MGECGGGLRALVFVLRAPGSGKVLKTIGFLVLSEPGSRPVKIQMKKGGHFGVLFGSVGGGLVEGTVCSFFCSPDPRLRKSVNNNWVFGTF